ncbi:MAG TPA: alanine racemase [Pyrinomonadaceae bacterium]
MSNPDEAVREDVADVGGELVARRPTWAEINLDALASNFHVVRRLVGDDVGIMAVVKANAYGHGAAECARRLAAEGANWFAVATPEEGVELRRAGIVQPVLCLGGFWEGQAGVCIEHNLVPVIYRVETAAAFDAAARAANVVRDVHVKIDTGMGRLGIRYDAAWEFAESLRSFKNLRVDGLMTHFAVADDPDRDCFTEDQIKRYREAAEAFRARGHQPTYEDMANSAGTFGHREAWGNMVRPGGVLYGFWRDVLPPQADAPALRPVMSVRSHIMLLKRIHRGELLGYGCTFEASRETLVATLPIGYHDGYMRALSNRGRVVVRGTYAPVVGRISMDLTLLDVTSVPGVATGDPVTLLGEDGELTVPAEDIARTAGTISYEVTCGISERVPRVFLPRNQS